LADRKVVGWALSDDMTTENTVSQAWLNARATRGIKEGFVFHSDRGIQYTSNKIVALLNQNIKINQSMSRKGNCWDNAVAESFFKTIKYEGLNRCEFNNT
jgi:transposase InsO family protein